MEAGVGSATTAIRVVPTGGGVGAEVLGVDLRGVDDAAFAAVHRAWIAHGVLLFRGQRLTDEDSGRLQPAARRARSGAGAGDRPALRRGASGDLCGLQRRRERAADRQPRGRGGGVAHRHVVSAGAAEGEPAVCAGGAAGRAATPGSATCIRPLTGCPLSCAPGWRGCGSSTTAPTTAAAMCGRAWSPPTIRVCRRGPRIR